MGRRQNFHHRKTSTLNPATTRRPVYTLDCEEPIIKHYLPSKGGASDRSSGAIGSLGSTNVTYVRGREEEVTGVP